MAGLCARGQWRSCPHRDPEPQCHRERPRPRPHSHWTTLLVGAVQLLLASFPQAMAAAQALAEMPNVVELWQVEEGDVFLHTQATSEQSVDELPLEQRIKVRVDTGYTNIKYHNMLSFFPSPMLQWMGLLPMLQNAPHSWTTSYHLSFVEKFGKRNVFNHKSIRKWSARSILKSLGKEERVDPEKWFPEQTLSHLT